MPLNKLEVIVKYNPSYALENCTLSKDSLFHFLSNRDVNNIKKIKILQCRKRAFVLCGDQESFSSALSIRNSNLVISPSNITLDILYERQNNIENDIHGLHTKLSKIIRIISETSFYVQDTSAKVSAMSYDTQIEAEEPSHPRDHSYDQGDIKNIDEDPKPGAKHETRTDFTCDKSDMRETSDDQKYDDKHRRDHSHDQDLQAIKRIQPQIINAMPNQALFTNPKKSANQKYDHERPRDQRHDQQDSMIEYKKTQHIPSRKAFLKSNKGDYLTNASKVKKSAKRASEVIEDEKRTPSGLKEEDLFDTLNYLQQLQKSESDLLPKEELKSALNHLHVLQQRLKLAEIGDECYERNK